MLSKILLHGKATPRFILSEPQTTVVSWTRDNGFSGLNRGSKTDFPLGQMFRTVNTNRSGPEKVV